MEPHGFCDDAFTPVRDAFLRNFAEGLEVGAAVAVGDPRRQTGR